VSELAQPVAGVRVAGKYELIEVAGKGGMATVWRAYQHGPGSFRRQVAVKQLYPHLAEQAMYEEMFIEEARVGAELRDPNIAQVYDFISDSGQYYLILEWIEGIELATYIDYLVAVAQRPARWENMVAAGIGMLRGLSAAHERVDEDGAPQPIVHRDVSPHNLVISETGNARLIDFGLSLATDRPGEDTDPGIAKGKISYLAPEILHGGRANPLSDQFSAAATLWEALAGRKLFFGETPHETLRMIADGRIVPLQAMRTDVPIELCHAVHKALSPDPSHRFPTTRVFANQLATILAASNVRDTYTGLGETVREARLQLALGHRSQPAAPAPRAKEDESAVIALEGADLETPNVSELWTLPGS
jgi:serine/threonine protein kinase